MESSRLWNKANKLDSFWLSLLLLLLFNDSVELDVIDDAMDDSAVLIVDKSSVLELEYSQSSSSLFASSMLARMLLMIRS